MSASARRYSHLLQTPEAAKSHLRVSSKDRFLTRSIQSTAIGDSIDGNRYSISYLPGISEHIIETGKTLPEAQMKIVMMACELERISAQNYELVKENEVLRTQTIKSEREKDLETKLAIVLAENEKLNQVIEELYNTYMDEKGANTNEVYEKRIAEVVNELEQWKQRYSTLQGSQGGFDVENTLKSLEEENRRLNETLVEKDREMETFRARLEARDPSAEVGVLEEKILWLVEENTKLKEGTKGQKTPEYYERLVREYREKMTLLMAENDNLRDLVEKRTVHETDVVMRSSGHEDVKMAGTPRQPDMMKHNEEMKKREYDIERLSEKLSAMLMENEKLNAIVERQMEHIEELEKQQRKSVELFSKTEEVTAHNEQLNELLRAKLEETEKMRKEMGDLKVVNTNFDELSVKVKELLERNDELNNLVMEKVYEVEDLKQRLSIVGESDAISEELKQKLLIVTTENERLNRLLVEKIEEVEKIRRDLEKSDSHHEGESVNEGLRKRIRELENDVLIIHELRNKLQLVLVENERLNSLVEGEQARKRLSEIDQNAMKVQELTRTIEILRGEQERMSKVIAEKQAEIDHLRSRHEESGHKIHKSVETLMEENDKLSALVIEKARENDALRVRMNALEGSDRLVEELKIRLHAIIAENERLNNIALSEAREHKQLAGQVDEMNRSAVKVDDLKRDVEAYRIEAERLNRAVIEKTMDNERLVMKIAELQSSLAALNEATSTIVKLGAENERLKALVNEKVGELGRVTTLEGKLVLISSENQRLLIEIDLLKTRIAEDKTQELEVRVDELLKEKATLIRHIEALEKEIEGLKGEHLNVVSTLSVDLERHQEELKKAGAHHQRKADEMEMKDRRIIELEGEIEMMKKKTEELDEKLVVTGAQKEELALVLEDKEKEIEEFERKSVEDLRRSRIAFDEAENEKKILASEKEMLGKTITTLEEEYKILKGHLNQVLAELEDLRARHGELEMIREQEIEDFRSQFETLKDISKEIKELQVKTAAERVAYETQLAQYQMVKADLERERDLLRSENERLTALAVHRLEEAEKIKRSVIESEEVYKLEVSELKIKVEQYKVRDHEVKKLAIKYGAEKAADQCLINQLQQMNATYKTEIENLYELLDERKTDIESVHKQNEELRHSQSQLIVRLKEHVEMGGVSSQDKLEALQRDFEQVEKSRDEYKHQAQRNSVELARRNKDLVEKIQELDVLKIKYEEAFANYQALNSKLFERLSVQK